MKQCKSRNFTLVSYKGSEGMRIRTILPIRSFGQFNHPSAIPVTIITGLTCFTMFLPYFQQESSGNSTISLCFRDVLIIRSFCDHSSLTLKLKDKWQQTSFIWNHVSGFAWRLSMRNTGIAIQQCKTAVKWQTRTPEAIRTEGSCHRIGLYHQLFPTQGA